MQSIYTVAGTNSQIRGMANPTNRPLGRTSEREQKANRLGTMLPAEFVTIIVATGSHTRRSRVAAGSVMRMSFESRFEELNVVLWRMEDGGWKMEDGG